MRSLVNHELDEWNMKDDFSKDIFVYEVAEGATKEIILRSAKVEGFSL